MLWLMDGQFTPQWRPEPEPSNALERLLQKAQDPAVHGRMMRALWDTELHTLIAYHPELEGMMELTNGSPMPQFIQIDDGTVPVPAPAGRTSVAKPAASVVPVAASAPPAVRIDTVAPPRGPPPSAVAWTTMGFR